MSSAERRARQVSLAELKRICVEQTAAYTQQAVARVAGLSPGDFCAHPWARGPCTHRQRETSLCVAALVSRRRERVSPLAARGPRSS